MSGGDVTSLVIGVLLTVAAGVVLPQLQQGGYRRRRRRRLAEYLDLVPKISEWPEHQAAIKRAIEHDLSVHVSDIEGSRQHRDRYLIREISLYLGLALAALIGCWTFLGAGHLAIPAVIISLVFLVACVSVYASREI